MNFTYRSKGSADDWTNDTIKAETREEALEKLDIVYGIIRDDNGVQTNKDMVQVELTGESGA